LITNPRMDMRRRAWWSGRATHYFRHECADRGIVGRRRDGAGQDSVVLALPASSAAGACGWFPHPRQMPSGQAAWRCPATWYFAARGLGMRLSGWM